MTTAQGLDDHFDEVEQAIDWVERLEHLRSRHDRETASRAAIQYVEELRQAVRLLAGPLTTDELAERCGDSASLAANIALSQPDVWTERIRPALLADE